MVSYHAAEVAQSRAEKIGVDSRPPMRPVDDVDVNRSYAICGAMGLLACTALSLMMQHAAQVHRRRAAGPVASAVDRALGSRLVAPSSFRVGEEGGARIGLLTLHPLEGIRLRNLVQDAGVLAWRALGPSSLLRLDVTCAEASGARHFTVPSPFGPPAPLVERPLAELR